MAYRGLGGVHVLVVEDTDDSREILRMALDVTTASAAVRKPRAGPRSRVRRVWHVTPAWFLLWRTWALYAQLSAYMVL